MADSSESQNKIHRFKSSNGKEFVFEELGEDGPLEPFAKSHKIAKDLLPLDDLLSFLSCHRDFIYFFDKDHRFTFVGNSLLSLWGISLEEARGKNFKDLGYPPELVELHEEQLDIAFNGKTIRGENVYSNGEEDRFYEYIFTPLADEKGSIRSVSGITRDISHRKRIEEEKEYLLYAIAHDLRSPLSVISSAVELSLGQALSKKETGKNARRILDQVKKLDSMIVDLLDSAKIKSGMSLQLNSEESNIYDIIKSVAEELMAAHGERFNIELNPEHYDAYRGMWDVMSIRRLAYNLVGNAIKYGDPEKPIKIFLNAQINEIQLRIENHGEPISPDKLKTLKKMMEGKRKAPVKSEKGWGIGLVIVRGIVDAYGGEIHVASDAQEGTVFCISFPKFEKARSER